MAEFHYEQTQDKQRTLADAWLTHSKLTCRCPYRPQFSFLHSKTLVFQEIVFDTAVFHYELTYDNKGFLEHQKALESRYSRRVVDPGTATGLWIRVLPQGCGSGYCRTVVDPGTAFFTNLSIESIYLFIELREKWPYLQNYHPKKKFNTVYNHILFHK